HHIIQRNCFREYCRRASHVTHSTEPDHLFDYFLVRLPEHVLVSSPDHAVTKEHFALVSEINARNGDVFGAGVFPDIQFSPVGDRKATHVLSDVDLTIEHIKELGTLVFLIPQSNVIPYRKHALFGSGFFLISSRAADAGVELEFLDRVQKRRRLQRISASVATALFPYFSLVDRVLDISDDEFESKFFHQIVPKLNRLREVVSRVDVKEWKRDLRRKKGLLSQSDQGDGVFSSGKKQNRALKLRRHFPKDMDRCCFFVIANE